MDNKSVTLISNYHDPRAVHYMKRRIKGLKGKLKVSCTTVIHQYIKKYMGGVDLSDQMKVSYEVDQRSKFRFYLQVFLEFQVLSVLKLFMKKIQSSIATSSMDFQFSLGVSMIGNFCHQKRALATSRPSKR